MTTAPKINLLDGSGVTTNLVVTTNLLGLMFTGTVDSNVIDVQVNINGNGFISDPTLVGLTLPNFRIPNPSSYPSGLFLEKGQNTILVRAIDLFGSVSPTSSINVTVVADVDMQSFLTPPTGVRIQRNATSVSIEWSDPSFILPTATSPQLPYPVSGYNVYSSVGSGGTISGYLRLNKDLIPANSYSKIVTDELTTMDTEFDLTDTNGNDLIIQSFVKNPITGAIVEQKTLSSISLITSPSFKLHTIVTNQISNKFYTFKHDRSDGISNGILNNDTFGAIPDEDPIFYVVTSVYINSSTGQVTESRFSQEMTGNPIHLDTTVRGINIRTRRTVSQDYLTEIQKTQPTLSMIPGSTVREVHIEPFSNEVQKAYFLLDFVHRSKSFSALLQIDDPGLTGSSVPVANSQYKQNLASAIGISSENAVQSLINGAFDSLAQNFGETRGGRRAASVMQTFYVTSKPTRDMVVTQGAIVSSSTDPNAPKFRSSSQVTLTSIDSQRFYNADKKRYEVKVQLTADTPGIEGNLSAGSIDVVNSGASGFKTINDTSADFGTDSQSNLELAEVCIRKLSSLDTGTFGGYEKIAKGTPGVLDVKVVRSGDLFMMRDYDEVRKKHAGGKVDIYIKGVNERTVVEPFAFQFDQAISMRFDVIDPISMTFRARDSRVTEANPISQMMYNVSQGLGLRNHSNLPTTSYDLTGVTIVDYRTIRLNTLIPQPTTHLDDFVEGDYRFRSNNKFFATLQPVRRVTSVVGELSGSLDAVLGYTLYKLEDPLLTGFSTIAKDYVVINQVGSIPSGQSIQINDEAHVLIGQFEEALNSVGVNTSTLRVFNRDRTVEYNGPSSKTPDYLIVAGSQKTHAKIIRTTLSKIVSGSSVSVDYSHDENFSMTYVVNDILIKAQERLKTSQHVTADVVVKEAIENPMSSSITVQLKKNSAQSTSDDNIRTSVTLLTDSKSIGESIHQSDMTTKIGEVESVEYIVQPFTKMTLQNNSIRIRDSIQPSYVSLPKLNKFNNSVYLLTQSLPFNTMDSGGNSVMHHGVFMDDQIMESSLSLEQVGEVVNSSWIIGLDGAVIPGYSDDATLLPIYLTQDGVISARKTLTSNRVVISLNSGVNPPDLPSDHTFSASYLVYNDVGSKDINVSSVEYVTPGDLTITFKPYVQS